jgi:penicillin-binding protein 1B
VWVGFDDYSDLKLSGAASAAPIWAEFMKRAQKVPAYSNMTEFKQPDGVVDVRIDKVTNRLSTPNCPDAYAVAFIAGTEPKDTCEDSDHKNILQRIFGFMSPQNPAPPPGSATNIPATSTPPPNGQPVQAQNNPPADDKKKKKGFFGKIVGVFKDDNNKSQ